VLDLATESTLSLAAAARLVPPARGGKRTHLSTLLRWIVRGAKAPDGSPVRLEAIRLGGRWLTSREALQRFVERLTPDLDTVATVPTPRTPGRRQRASERAAQQLEKMGV
jgi:hypothetical protein